MKICDIVESVESGDIEQRLYVLLAAITDALKYFDYYANAHSYDEAASKLAAASLPINPLILLLAQNNKASAKLAAKYETLRQIAINKIQCGI